MIHRWRWLGSSLLAFTVTAWGAAAQTPEPVLEQAKALYAAASFEEALTAIARVEAGESAEPEVLLYKALCLLALGRTQEAGVTAKSLVTVSPTFSPDTSALPPRFQTLWSETRKAVVPTLTKELFASARGQFQARDYAASLVRFEQVLTLTDDPTWKESTEAGDLRTLATGFIELAHASIPKPAPAPPVAADTPPTPPAAVVVEPAVAIRQDMPRWTPTDWLLARQTFDGAVRISIDATGRVTDAVMLRPTHRSYDGLLIRAARDWVYKPAMRNGQPIDSEKIVDVRLGAAEP